MEVNTRILRHIPTGITYAYQEVFAARADFEEVFPPAPEGAEMFSGATKPKSTRTKRVVEAQTASEPVAQQNADAIGVDATRDLP